MAIQGRDYRAEIGDSPYPFCDAASLTATTGVRLDPAAIVDAAVYAPDAQARLGITRIETTAAGVATVWVGDAADAVRAAATIGLDAIPDEAGVVDRRGRPAGLLVLDAGLVAAWRGWPVGAHPFPAGAAEFAPSCVIPLPGGGVRALEAGGALVADDAWIVGERGVVVRPDGDGRIRVDVVGDPLFVRRLCDPAGAGRLDVRTVRTINGVPPNPDGSFHVVVTGAVADTILRVVPQPPHTLVISAAGRVVRSNRA